MDGCPRQNPAYGLLKENPALAGFSHFWETMRRARPPVRRGWPGSDAPREARGSSWRRLGRRLLIGGAGLVCSPCSPCSPSSTHGTIGVASYRARSAQGEHAYPSIDGLAESLRAGYVAVAPDDEGLGTPGPHLVGGSAAWTALDAVRAAVAFEPAGARPLFAALRRIPGRAGRAVHRPGGERIRPRADAGGRGGGGARHRPAGPLRGRHRSRLRAHPVRVHARELEARLPGRAARQLVTRPARRWSSGSCGSASASTATRSSPSGS